MIRIKTVNGDVIADGSVKNVNYHYYNEDKKADRQDNLPEELRTPKALELNEKLRKAGLVDELWKPQGLTGIEKGILVSEVAGILGIRKQWILFGTYWDEAPQTLRSYLNKGMEQAGGGEFIDRLKEALKE